MVIVSVNKALFLYPLDFFFTIIFLYHCQVKFHLIFFTRFSKNDLKFKKIMFLCIPTYLLCMLSHCNDANLSVQRILQLEQTYLKVCIFLLCSQFSSSACSLWLLNANLCFSLLLSISDPSLYWRF